MILKKVDLRFLVASVFFVLMFALIFARLGYYPLWDDEVNTALFAHSVWYTGDTSAIYGVNIWGYRNGVELNSALMNRLIPPLGYYFVAPFIGLLGNDVFYVRLPFAIVGLLTILIVIFWLFESKATLKTHVLVSCGFIGNISYILYSKQCRYYALAMLFSLLASYCYVKKIKGCDQRPGWVATVFLSIILVFLLATHYIAYAAVTCALMLDYFLWGRKHNLFSCLQLLLITFSQIIAVLCIVSIWYPLGKKIELIEHSNWILAKLNLLYMFVREVNSTEMLLGFVIFVAPIVYYFKKNPNPLLLRLTFACIVILVIAVCFAPQTSTHYPFGDVRYVTFALPLFIYLTVVVIESLSIQTIYQYCVTGLVFFTTVFNILFSNIIFGYPIPLRSTFAFYMKELVSPPHIAFRAAADWLNKHAKQGDTAVVLPSYDAYSLMYHAPHVIYGWQFEVNKKKEFAHLPAIQYIRQAMPDYIIFFGQDSARRSQFLGSLSETNDVHYLQVASLPVNSMQSSRAELFWHTFEDAKFINTDSDGVYIYKRSEKQLSAYDSLDSLSKKIL